MTSSKTIKTVHMCSGGWTVSEFKMAVENCGIIILCTRMDILCIYINIYILYIDICDFSMH
jgi:hypothetical protein